MLLTTLGLCSCILANAADAIPGFREARVAEQQGRESALTEAIDPARLRQWHDLLGSEPHRAGTPGDLRQIERLADAFSQMGLEVETHWFEAYLCEPVSAQLRITAPDTVELAVTEPPRPNDPHTADPALDIAWNAYSGSGSAEAGVVYANYGRLEDFQRLAEAGVEVSGKIVIARYGGNYRGFKAKYAQEAGAAGLIIYTDPADHGVTTPEQFEAAQRGDTTPTPDQVQRGSVITLDYVGDPLTPNGPADEAARRRDPADIPLPAIPVQPIGWRSAHEILSRMSGEPVPADWERWRGGLPIDYRLTGGDELRVHIEVHQERKLVRTANVVGTLRGTRAPHQEIIIGAHHDAWGHGAVDPLSGTILVMETARVFAQRTEDGDRPARTLQFAAWGAEEFGIIGSTEWVEQHVMRLADDAVAYINLDAAVTGPNFSAAAAPMLKALVIDATRAIPQAGADTTVYEAWSARTRPAGAEQVESEPPVGTLGGGSDHVGLYCVLGVPSMFMSAGGSRGTSYHSNYDTLAWYRQHVGDDYQPAAMVARVVAVAASRLADADVIPYDPTRYAPDLHNHLSTIRRVAADKGVTLDTARLDEALAELDTNAQALASAIDAALADPQTPDAILDRASMELIALSRAWIRSRGLPDRPWYRSQFVAPDPTSGYSAWMLPGLRWAVEQGGVQGQAAVAEQTEVVRNIVKRLAVKCRQMTEMLQPRP